MSIESDLIECFVRNGISYQSARLEACHTAARLVPIIERERLEHACRDLFYTKSRANLAAEHGVHRSTVYRKHDKLSQTPIDDATKAA